MDSLSDFEAFNECSFYFLACSIKNLAKKNSFCKLLFETQPACTSYFLPNFSLRFLIAKLIYH